MSNGKTIIEYRVQMAEQRRQRQWTSADRLVSQLTGQILVWRPAVSKLLWQQWRVYTVDVSDLLNTVTNLMTCQESELHYTRQPAAWLFTYNKPLVRK